MTHQILYFLQDVKRMLGKRKARIIYIWLSRSFAGLFLYRIERGLFLTFGKPYEILRLLFIPIIVLIQAYSNIDIHYKAAIKGGILVLHPAVGVVISGHAIVGSNLTLTGGNIIGINKTCRNGEFVIGDDCNMGANAVVLGPLKLANGIRVGAMACVVKNYSEPGITLIGIPATMKSTN